MSPRPKAARRARPPHGLRDRVHRLLQREDFRRNPLKALWRRVLWRLRWRITAEPWILRFKKDLKIAVANDGQGALLCYQGCSEAETEDFIVGFLRPGMVFIDVGAHVGKYTLLAARAVGSAGEVHAFEPNPAVFGLLQKNVRLNRLGNVFTNRCAVSDVEGERDFEVRKELTICSLRPTVGSSTPEGFPGGLSKIVRVPCISLDAYCSSRFRKPDLVKIDVEGAELPVLRGAQQLLALPMQSAPVWVFEYAPANYARFGYGPDELIAFLETHGYAVWRCQKSGRIAAFRFSKTGAEALNLIAARKGRPLRSMA